MGNNDFAGETVTITKTEYEELNHLKREHEFLRQREAWLLEQLKLSRRRQFGTSSEKTDSAQMSFFNEAEANADPKAEEPKLTAIKEHYRKSKTRLTTDKLPPDLPMEIVEHELPETEQSCPDCGHSLHVMGHETREELKLVPAKAVIVKHVRSVYACRECEKTNDHVPIKKAAMPKPVILGSFASPEAIAHIAVQKFVMASPLYRQEQEWQRNGIQLSRQTMSNWLIKAENDWLTPIYNRLQELLCARDVLHGDETTVQVLHESGKPAQSKSYMWLYRSSGDTEKHIVLYDYQPDRKQERPQVFLKDFTGYLHTDGYDVYHKLPSNITVVGCWAHTRRKFDEALKALAQKDQLGSQALHGLNFCNRLFRIEKQLADLTPDERKAEREKQSAPIIVEFYAWLETLKALPQHPLGKAAFYAQSQRKYLERYLLDGRLEISNNRAERSIKPFVIGRKNWLFSNTPKGAKASAVFYSLIETAKENGLNPMDYLTAVFRMAPNKPPDGSVDLLLPWNLAVSN